MSVEEFKRQIEEQKAALAEDLKKVEAPVEAISEEVTQNTDSEDTEVTEVPSTDIVSETGAKYTEDELKAIEMGWKPDHKGPNYVSAKEFVERGSFFKQIEARNKKIDSLEAAMKELLNHNKKIEQAAYTKGVQEALKQRTLAVEVGDVQAFNQAEAQLQDLQRQSQQVAPVEQVQAQQTISDESKAFIARNTAWFNRNSNENAQMTDLAVSYGDYLQKNNPGMSETEILTNVEATIKAMPQFKHRFENEKKTAPQMVSRSSVTGGSKTSTATKLSPQQRNLFEQAKRIDSSLNIEDYARQLDLTGDLKND
jgi:hypothetical protein